MERMREAVARLGNVEWFEVRANALVNEVEAGLAYFNLLGQTWTGQVLQTQEVV